MRNSREFEELRDSMPSSAEELAEILARMPNDSDEDMQAIYDMIDNWAFINQQR